ncbi:hypothetical protein LTR95_012416 [Oleoguttula sp. CCFEE 5521]
MSARMIVVVFVAFLFNLAAAMDVPNQSGWEESFFENALSYAGDAAEFMAEAAVQTGVACASTSPRTAAIMADLLHSRRVLESFIPPDAEVYVHRQALEVQHHQLPNDVAEPARPFQYPPPTPPEPRAYYVRPADRLPTPVSRLVGWVTGTFTPMVHSVIVPAALRPQQPLHPDCLPSATPPTLGTQRSLARLAPAPQAWVTPSTSISSGHHRCRHSGCGQSRATRAALRKHQKSHIPQANRKHACTEPDCERRFNEKKDLVKHRLTHNVDHTERFPCLYEHCKAHTGFIVRWDNFRRHMKNVHGIIVAESKPQTNDGGDAFGS